MPKETFINEAFTFAINEFLNSKSKPNSIAFNSFAVVIIRLLTIIYDELDIINPFYLNSESSFDKNLQKFGYPYSGVVKFKDDFTKYYELENPETFTEVQKDVIDMFIKKKNALNVSEEETKKFASLLHSPQSDNMLLVSYNFLMASDPMEVINYYNNEIEKNKPKPISKPRKTLNIEAYELFKYSLEDIKNMDSKDLDMVNKNIYTYFKINENAINKEYLLDRAVYDYKNPKPSFSTGNGYVDILLIMALVATLATTIFVITIIAL